MSTLSARQSDEKAGRSINSLFVNHGLYLSKDWTTKAQNALKVAQQISKT